MVVLTENNTPDHKMASTLYFCLRLPLFDTILHGLPVHFSKVHEAVSDTKVNHQISFC